MAKSIKKTNEDLAKILSTDSTTARGLLGYLREKGLATENGKRPNSTGRGKGAIEYDVDWTEVSKHFAAIKGE